MTKPDPKQQAKKRDATSNAERICIVLPTYNEAQNITLTLNAIYLATSKLPFPVHTLVVDDNSPDGTATIVKRYQRSNNQVHLLRRKHKQGLGAAYIAGITHALDNLHPTILFEMDADLSHDPNHIPEMVKEIRNGADIVIGSRYVPGASIPQNWGWKRVMMSKSANLYARTILRLSVNDCTGGFRAFRARALRSIDLDNLDVNGYAFQIVLLYHLIRQGYTVKEVPIQFFDREYGNSKLGMHDITELAIRVPGLLFS